jgi:cbb3-type cytochrome oxidase maturation protein
MDILYLLIPIALVILGIAVWAFIWAVNSGQYEDMEGPAHRILMDDDEVGTLKEESKQRENDTRA